MIIAIANRKGGVGKTTIAVALAAKLAAKLADEGRVLLVDLDSQASATEMLGIPLQPGVFTWLGAESLPAVVRLDTGLEVLPGDARTERANLILSSEGDVAAIHRGLQPLRRTYQYIILDCPPSLSMLTRAAIYAADAVLCPTVPEYLSVAGVRQLTVLMANIREQYRRPVQLLGIQPNKYDLRTNEHHANLTDLVRVYGAWGRPLPPCAGGAGGGQGLVWPPLRQRIAVAVASAEGQSLWDALGGVALAEWAAMVERVKNGQA